MAEDIREDIINRLEEIAAGLVSDSVVYRNPTDIPETKLPAFAIVDGDEEVVVDNIGRGRPANSPMVMALRPAIHLFVGGDVANNPGLKANAHRAALIKAVTEDAMLISLSHNNGIFYEGMSFMVHKGRVAVAELGLSFRIDYVLRPSKL